MKGIIRFTDVIAKNKEREEADKLRNEFYLVEQCTSGGSNDDHDGDDFDLTPVEELSMRISGDLAYIAAERFSEMVDGMAIDSIKTIILRMKNSDDKTAVKMLQSMFLIEGFEDAAYALDLLKACHEYTDEIYEWFIDDLFETDIFDWFLTDLCLCKARETACLPACLS